MNLLRSQWLLYGVAAFIVIVPYFMLERFNKEIQEADQWVAHSAQVEATTSQLLYETRDLEAAAATLSADVDAPAVRRRIAESEMRIPKLIGQLIALTTDNPEQQVRVGELKSRVEQRRMFSMRIVNASTQGERQRILSSMVSDFPMRGAANEVLAEEAKLLAERSKRAERLRQQGRFVSFLTSAAQLGLLSLLLWISLRYQRQRQDAEDDASRANARALAVMQSIRDPIALLDREKNVLMHNMAFEELYGADDDMAIDGQHLSKIGAGAWTNRETLQRLRDVVSRGRELWDFEVAQTTADGVDRTMLLNARRINLPDRQDEVALLTMIDISSQKASEEAISELNRQLEGKIEQVSDVNRELEAFSYSVSHDLRAPLRHISGFADKLARQMGDDADEKSRHYISTIDSSARRMATLIDDLLVYSRLGRSALRLQPVDMQSLVSETRALLDSNASVDTPGRRIEWHIDAMPMVIADENMMRQVWLNLLGNAVKYSTPREQTRIDVSYERLDDGRHEFTVKDNGVGFDMQYARKLFGVFQRMHKASDFPGTGIGLASVQRVLMRHGGTITAESAVDQGTTFRFTLPAMLDNPAKSLPASA